jgi:hypothetical protein
VKQVRLSSAAGSLDLLSFSLVPDPEGEPSPEGASLAPVTLYPTAAVTDNGNFVSNTSDFWCV